MTYHSNITYVRPVSSRGLSRGGFFAEPSRLVKMGMILKGFEADGGYFRQDLILVVGGRDGGGYLDNVVVVRRRENECGSGRRRSRW